jgi:hypothetical protein
MAIARDLAKAKSVTDVTESVTNETPTRPSTTGSEETKQHRATVSKEERDAEVAAS